MVKYSFKHNTLRAYRKEILDMVGKSKNVVKRIYIQSYSHPDVEGTRTFEIRNLVPEERMNKILLSGQSPLQDVFKDELGDLLKILRKNNIVSIHGNVCFNKIYVKEIQNREEQ